MTSGTPDSDSNRSTLSISSRVRLLAAVWVAVSHGDIIKSVLADALGMHLDLFQRISVDPASLSIVRYTDQRPYVLASNTHEGDLSWLVPPAHAPAAPDAAVGGGAGPGEQGTGAHP